MKIAKKSIEANNREDKNSSFPLLILKNPITNVSTILIPAPKRGELQLNAHHKRNYQQSQIFNIHKSKFQYKNKFTLSEKSTGAVS
ncbi:hypothetical protein BCT35_23665 [Vibrio lentus]|nr:hypothetical protein BCT75_01550 [Vibrio lentus]PMN27781.1 hypothetical protein BCT35_23665 [Vibrio lentus]